MPKLSKIKRTQIIIHKIDKKTDKIVKLLNKTTQNLIDDLKSEIITKAGNMSRRMSRRNSITNSGEKKSGKRMNTQMSEFRKQSKNSGRSIKLRYKNEFKTEGSPQTHTEYAKTATESMYGGQKSFTTGLFTRKSLKNSSPKSSQHICMRRSRKKICRNHKNKFMKNCDQSPDSYDLMSHDGGKTSSDLSNTKNSFNRLELHHRQFPNTVNIDTKKSSRLKNEEMTQQNYLTPQLINSKSRKPRNFKIGSLHSHRVLNFDQSNKENRGSLNFQMAPIMHIIEEKPEKDINFSAFKKYKKQRQHTQNEEDSTRLKQIRENLTSYYNPQTPERDAKKKIMKRARPSSCKPTNHKNLNETETQVGKEVSQFHQFTPPNYDNEETLRNKQGPTTLYRIEDRKDQNVNLSKKSSPVKMRQVERSFSNKSSPEKMRKETIRHPDSNTNSPSELNFEKMIVRTGTRNALGELTERIVNINRQKPQIQNIELFKILQKKAVNNSPDSLENGKSKMSDGSTLEPCHYDYKYGQEQHLLEKLGQLSKENHSQNSKYYNSLYPETSTTEEYYSRMLLKYFTKKEDIEVMNKANKIYGSRSSKGKKKILMMSSQNNVNVRSGFIRAGIDEKMGMLNYHH